MAAFKSTCVGINGQNNTTLGEFILDASLVKCVVENTYGVTDALCTIVASNTPVGGGYTNYQVSESLDDVLASMNVISEPDLSIVGDLAVGGDIDVNTNKFNVDGPTGDTLIAGTLGVAGATDLAAALNVGGLFTSEAGVVFGGTPQTLTGAGAVNLTTFATLLVTTAADALTLADGAVGQLKFIQMKTDGGNGTLTPTNLRAGSTITFNDVNDFVLLFFVDAEWTIVVNSGCTVA